MTKEIGLLSGETQTIEKKDSSTSSKKEGISLFDSILSKATETTSSSKEKVSSSEQKSNDKTQEKENIKNKEEPVLNNKKEDLKNNETSSTGEIKTKKLNNEKIEENIEKKQEPTKRQETSSLNRLFVESKDILKNKTSITGQYLSHKKFIEIPRKRRLAKNGRFVEINGASGNNLNNVNLKIPLGSFTCVTGVSGSGKSTFLNILGGLDQPASGKVFFKGKDLANFNNHELTYFRREHVGFVFQAYNLVPSLTALENVALVTEISPQPMDPLEALEIVGLKNRANHFPSQMSGGEQQRVAIARALAKQPEVLLCDEPTGALDSETGIVVLNAILKVNEEFGTTTIIITHNAAIAEIAHRVIHFADGMINQVHINDTRKLPEQINW